MAAEGVHLEWSHAVGDIERTAEEILAQWKSVEDKVAGVPLGEVTYDNTVLELAKLNADIGHINENIDFYQYVSTDKAIRDASVAASKKISAFNVKSSMRIDVSMIMTGKGSERMMLTLIHVRCISASRRCSRTLKLTIVWMLNRSAMSTTPFVTTRGKALISQRKNAKR